MTDEVLGHARWCRAVCLLLPIGLVLALGCSYWVGFIGSDDLYYAIRTHRVWSEPIPTSHQDGRFVMNGLVGLSFAVFGVSETALALVPLVSTAATAAALVVLGQRLFGWAVGLIAGILFALFPLNVYHATIAVPEPVASFEMTLAAICFLEARARSGSVLFAVSAGLLAGLAYLTTEAGSLILVVLIGCGILMRDAIRTQLFTITGFLVILLVEILYYSYQSGQPLGRFAGQYSLDPMVVSANTDLLDRLLKGYSRYFVWPNEDFGAWGPIFLASIGLGLWRFRESALPLLWSVVLLAFYNFGSARLDRYVALPVATRLIIIALPPLFILTARLAIVSWHAVEAASGGIRWVMWLGRTSVIAGGVCLIVVGLVACDLARNRGVTAAAARNAKVIAEYLKSQEDLLLISDARTLEFVRFYREFRARDRLIAFDKLAEPADGTLSTTGVAWVVLNGPIMNERAITGVPYGGRVSLSEAGHDVGARLRSLNIQPSIVYEWKNRRRWHDDRIVGPIAAMLHWRMTSSDIAPYAALAGIQAFRLPLSHLTGSNR